MALTIKKWLSQAKTLVNPLDAELILVNVFKAVDRTYLVTHEEVVLSANERQLADRMLNLRTLHVPLAYLTNEKDFFGRKFKITSDVLIPRPETETMVEMAIKLYNQKIQSKFEDFDRNFGEKLRSNGLKVDASNYQRLKDEYRKAKEKMTTPIIMFEVGVGSGCVAISLALECKKATVFGVDISKEALKVASLNAKKYKVKNFYLSEGDLLSEVKKEAPVPDIMIANLPYVDRTWEWRSPEIEFEPHIALYADNGGLALIYKLFRQIRSKWPSLFGQREKHQKYVLIESDLSQQGKIIRYAKRYGFKHTETKGLITCFEY